MERARALGVAHELGAYRRSYRSVQRVTRRDWGLSLLVFGGVADVGLIFAGQSNSETGSALPYAIGAFGVLAATGAALLFTAPRERADWVHVYDGGLAQATGGDPEAAVLRWDKLDRVLREYDTGTGDAEPDLVAIRAITTDGGEFVVGPGSTSIYQVGSDISEVLLTRRLPAAVERASSGVPVQFGGLSVSQEGIGWSAGTQWVSWPEVRWIRLTPWQVEIATTAGKRHKFWLNDVPDAPVALLIIQQVARGLGVRQKGALPYAAPALPERA